MAHIVIPRGGVIIKALCIIGSARSNGNTAFVVNKVIEGMYQSGIEVKRYALSDMNIDYCRGCNLSNETRKCLQIDHMDQIISDIFITDIVLIAAPSYWGDVPGQLKVFIDRSLPICDTRKGGNIIPEGKYGISIAIRAGQRKEENKHIIDTIEHYYSHLHIKPIERYTIEQVLHFSDLKEKGKDLKSLYELGLNVRKRL